MREWLLARLVAGLRVASADWLAASQFCGARRDALEYVFTLFCKALKSTASLDIWVETESVPQISGSDITSLTDEA
jgi:hypothetical protein